MNSQLIKLDLDRVLFFDIETVSKYPTIEEGTMEYDLFRYNTRDRVTDTFHDNEDLINLYKQKAALKPYFNKIVCITISTIFNGELIMKSFTGEESDIVRNFYKSAKKYDYLCGYNISSFDLPMIRFAALKNDPKILLSIKQDFNDSGKKPWELKNIIDLMDAIKGTYFHPLSLEEVCYMLGMGSPKTEDLRGSKVSEYYHEIGLDDIILYCEKDVLAVVNILKLLRGEDIFNTYKVL